MLGSSSVSPSAAVTCNPLGRFLLGSSSVPRRRGCIRWRLYPLFWFLITNFATQSDFDNDYSRAHENPYAIMGSDGFEASGSTGSV
ncbi:hypothetical protein L1887_30249 [Cichorium endivia]|nr:hypothetical protein L1887_30249 [Cichorium endivia]